MKALLAILIAIPFCAEARAGAPSWAIAPAPNQVLSSIPKPSPSPWVSGACDDICGQYSALSSQEGVQQACGSDPSNTNTITNGFGIFKTDGNGSSYNNCVGKLNAEWQQLGQHCDAYSLDASAEGLEVPAVAAYTATAALCWTACAATKTGFGAATAFLCVASGVVADGIDLFDQISISSQGGSDYLSGWISAANVSGSVAAGAGTVALGARTTSYVATGTKAGTDISSESTKQMESCIAAGFFTLAAVEKWAAWGSTQSTKNAECTTIQTFAGPGLGAQTQMPQAAPSGSLGGPAPIPGGSSAGGSSGKGGGGAKVSIPDPGSDFPNGAYAAATAGPAGQVLMNTPDRQNIPSALQDLTGSSLSDLGQAMAQGESPATAIGGMSGIPDAAKQAAKDLEDAVKQGRVTFSGEAAAMTAAAGGSAAKKAAPHSMFGGMFGGSGGLAAPSQAESAFAKAAPKPIAGIDDGGDIWHAHWTGSIFDIVTTKLGKLAQEKDRVERLEWSTPLNRALAGLPPEKKTTLKRGE